MDKPSGVPAEEPEDFVEHHAKPFQAARAAGFESYCLSCEKGFNGATCSCKSAPAASPDRPEPHDYDTHQINGELKEPRFPAGIADYETLLRTTAAEPELEKLLEFIFALRKKLEAYPDWRTTGYFVVKEVREEYQSAIRQLFSQRGQSK